MHDYMWWTSSNVINMITCEIHTHYNVHQESFSNIKKRCAWYTSCVSRATFFILIFSQNIKIWQKECSSCTTYWYWQKECSIKQKNWKFVCGFFFEKCCAWYTWLHVMNIIKWDKDDHMWDTHTLQYPPGVIFKHQKTLCVIYIIKCDKDHHTWNTHTLQCPPGVIFKYKKTLSVIYIIKCDEHHRMWQRSSHVRSTHTTISISSHFQISKNVGRNIHH